MKNYKPFRVGLSLSASTAIFTATLMIGQTGTLPSIIQPELGVRSAQILTMESLRFKDLNHNGQIDPYEDWRLSPQSRTADLLQRLSLEDLAGLLVHGSLIDVGSGANGNNAYDFDRARHWIIERHINSFVTRLNGTAVAMAAANNKIQEIAESSDFGIPVTISSDPKRHQIHLMSDARAVDLAFSLWPDPIGFAAIGDGKLTQQYADTARREYMAVGIREALAPQADLATEPRWTRTNGTFGEDSATASRMVEAYVTGVQDGSDGVKTSSVIAVVKHWVGYGAAKDGWDSHNSYGQFAAFQNYANFTNHVEPFKGAFRAHVGGVMPSYSVLQGITLDGKAVEPVGAGFNHQLLEDLLRGKYHFEGVILTDWLITHDCLESCREGAAVGTKPTLRESGMPWGVENLSEKQRYAKAINAGVDQIGGSESPNIIVEAVLHGAIPESRVREAAARVLLQKFQLGLFEQPYVDEQKAGEIAGSAPFVREGQAAQAKAVVLLENKTTRVSHRPLLPVSAGGQKIYLYGVSKAAAEAAGFTVVEDPTKASFAIVRAAAPYSSDHQSFYFGARQHEGRLNFTEADPAYVELLRVSRTTPTIFVVNLERPLALTNVKPHAAALLGDFGLADAPLFKVITGRVAPEGHLPFELPSSMEAVQNQASDLPHDSVAPLYPFGFGLHY